MDDAASGACLRCIHVFVFRLLLVALLLFRLSALSSSSLSNPVTGPQIDPVIALLPWVSDCDESEKGFHKCHDS